MRAVVTEIRETSAAVLCEDGQIRLIPAQNFRKGQEITLSAGRRRVRRPRMWTACAAVLCAMATTSVYAVCEPYSSVTVDGEESVEYTLNRFDWVIGTRVSGEKPPKGEYVPPFTHARDAVRQAVEREYANGQENVSITVSSHDSGRAEGLCEMLEKPGNGHGDDGAERPALRIRTAPPASEKTGDM